MIADALPARNVADSPHARAQVNGVGQIMHERRHTCIRAIEIVGSAVCWFCTPSSSTPARRARGRLSKCIAGMMASDLILRDSVICAAHE